MGAMRQSGFTLLELLSVILIAGILTAIAVPTIRVMVLRGQRSDASTSLYGAFSAARSEAVTRNSFVMVCPRASPTGTPTCGGTNWAAGWVLFRDTDGMFNSGEPLPADVISAGDPVNNSFSVVATNQSSPSGVSVVIFNPSGNTVVNTSGMAPAYTFKICQATTGSGGVQTAVVGSEGRTIYVDVGGRISLEQSTC